MNDAELIKMLDRWAWEEQSPDSFAGGASWDYRAGFRDACEAVRGMILANREPEGSETPRESA